MLSKLRNKVGNLTYRSIKPRHYVVILLMVFLVLYCILAAGATANGSRSFSIVTFTYTAGTKSSTTSSSLAASSSSPSVEQTYYSDALTSLTVEVGYFASCLQTNFLNQESTWSCSSNETQLILSSDNNFTLTSKANMDLFDLFQATAVEFRTYCLSPYVIIVSLAVSFLTLLMFALSSPKTNPGFYKWAAILCFLGFAITLVAAVWQETNVITMQHMLSGAIVDSYYVVETKYNRTARVLAWFGVGIMLLATGLLTFLAVLGTYIGALTDEIIEEEADEK